MEKLIRGIVEFRQTKLPGLREKFKMLAEHGQKPDVLFIACSDSRVVPNLFASTDPGDLFVVRTVGNLVAPSAANGISVGDVAEASAIEFGVEVLGVRHIVVCGHSKCGAMIETLKGRDKLLTTPNLAAWLEHAEPALQRLEKSPFIRSNLALEDRLSQANALHQLDNVATYPIVRERLAQNRLTLHAWWFNVSNGDVEVFDADRGGFNVLDEEEADRVLNGESSARVPLRA
jgi:carbonic anhydrase